MSYTDRVNQIKQKTVIVIGGGPSGCMAAISAKQHHPIANVLLIERNLKLGVKLRITGGGRCNITANVPNDEIITHTPRNGRFMFSSLDSFGPQNIINFFTHRGLNLKEEDHHRLFPVTNKSEDVVKVLEKELNDLGVRILFNTLIESVDLSKKQVIDKDSTFNFDALIIATGGITYTQTGSDGTGYQLLQQMGHSITDLKPSEVALVSNDALIQSKALQGLSFNDIKITSYVNNKKIITVTNDLLITHFGLSGPAALQSSSYLRDAFEHENHVEVKIDFLPNIPLESLQRQKDLQEKLQDYGLPKRLIAVLYETFPKHLIAEKVKAFTLTIHNTRGFANAFVTSGGQSLKEVEPKTMKSKLHPFLSICGETLDVNSLTGGYNMTLAFSSGFTAGKYCIEEE